MQQTMIHIRLTNLTLLTLGLAIGVLMTGDASRVLAQGPPPGAPGQPPGAPGGMNRPGGDMRVKMAGMKKWMTDHKNVGDLGGTLGGIDQINKAPDTKLSKPQATKILAIINTWKSKPTMTETEAVSVQKQLMELLNAKQQKALAALRQAKPAGSAMMGGSGAPGRQAMMGRPGGAGTPPMGGPGGPGMGGPGGPGMMGRPGGMGGPGGPGMGGPGGPGMMGFPDPPKGGFNPMNADTFPFEWGKARVKQTLTELTTSLQKQAK